MEIVARKDIKMELRRYLQHMAVKSDASRPRGIAMKGFSFAVSMRLVGHFFNAFRTREVT